MDMNQWINSKIVRSCTAHPCIKKQDSSNYRSIYLILQKSIDPWWRVYISPEHLLTSSLRQNSRPT